MGGFLEKAKRRGGEYVAAWWTVNGTGSMRGGNDSAFFINLVREITDVGMKKGINPKCKSLKKPMKRGSQSVPLGSNSS